MNFSTVIIIGVSVFIAAILVVGLAYILGRFTAEQFPSKVPSKAVGYLLSIFFGLAITFSFSYIGLQLISLVMPSEVMDGGAFNIGLPQLALLYFVITTFNSGINYYRPKR